MLGNTNAIANLAVKDLAKARRFYEDILGLTAVGNEDDELIAYRSGDSLLYVYRSEFAGSNRATAVTWEVGDRVDDIVRGLKAKGVDFEHYEMPGLKLEGDVHSGSDMRIAWFKDPDGNILSIVSS